MKRIVLCFDGTWNKPADESLAPGQQVETNVRRFFESVALRGADGVEQAPWYNAGVGTNWYDKVVGGAFGVGLDEHILAGYSHLVQTYAPGDEVYVLGFSRGAYTARSLVGMIRNCGLVKPSVASLKIGMAYGIYRTRQDGPDSLAARSFRAMFAQEIRIKFVGVWDTVGALGIPLHIVKDLNAEFYEFHDTTLSKIVENAYHAVAVDEHRVDYAVTLWDPPAAATQQMEQRWFCGAHADVGGGYDDRTLSDLALRWMQDKAAAVGLGFTALAQPAAPAAVDAVKPTDSYGAFLKGLYAKTHESYDRPVLKTPFGNEVLDPSVKYRRADAAAAYAPKNPGLPSIP